MSVFEEKERLHSVGSFRKGFSLSVGIEADQKRDLYNIRVYKSAEYSNMTFITECCMSQEG